MSHCIVGVIFPKKLIVSDPNLARLMEPFDEGKKVPPYKEQCYCKRSRILGIAHAAAEELVKINDLREKYNKLEEKDRPEWPEFIKEHIAIQKAVEKAVESIIRANPACEDCKGTGVYESTYNPQSRWDWYSPGGRWNGVITGKPRNDDTGFNSGDEFHQLKSNCCLVREVSWDNERFFPPFAILTPDGEWVEKGKMGMWGMVSEEKDKQEWEKTAKTVFDKYPDNFIVGVDVHI